MAVTLDEERLRFLFVDGRPRPDRKLDSACTWKGRRRVSRGDRRLVIPSLGVSGIRHFPMYIGTARIMGSGGSCRRGSRRPRRTRAARGFPRRYFFLADQLARAAVSGAPQESTLPSGTRPQRKQRTYGAKPASKPLGFDFAGRRPASRPPEGVWQVHTRAQPRKGCLATVWAAALVYELLSAF